MSKSSKATAQGNRPSLNKPISCNVANWPAILTKRRSEMLTANVSRNSDLAIFKVRPPFSSLRIISSTPSTYFANRRACWNPSSMFALTSVQKRPMSAPMGRKRSCLDLASQISKKGGQTTAISSSAKPPSKRSGSG